jgi:hypothetical protein
MVQRLQEKEHKVGQTPKQQWMKRLVLGSGTRDLEMGDGWRVVFESDESFKYLNFSRTET